MSGMTRTGPAAWPEVTVDDLKAPLKSAIAIGPFGSRMKSDVYVREGVPVIRGTNISAGRSFVGDLVFVSRELADDLRSSNVYADDLVFPHRGAIGEVGIVPQGEPERWMMSTSLMKVTVDPNVADPMFIYYFFRSPFGRHELLRRSSSVGTPGIAQPLASLKSVRLRLPPIDTQKAIAGVLGSCDDLIENNWRRIEILEEITRLIYREWFVHFRYPGREDVRFVDSDLGSIPEGWSVSTLAGLASYINRGIAPKYDEDSSSVVINQRCIRGHRVSLEFSRRQTKKVPEEKLVKKGDVLVNSTGVGTLGRVAPVRVEFDDTTVDSHVTIVRPQGGVDTHYFAELVLSLEPLFESMGTGSTGQTELSRARIGESQIVLAPQGIRDAFGDLVQPMSQLSVNLLHQNRALTEARDLLLPRLISGELDLSDLDLNSVA